MNTEQFSLPDLTSSGIIEESLSKPEKADWIKAEFEFCVRAGEFSIIKKTLNGLVLEPNIFNFKATSPTTHAGSMSDDRSDCGFIVSMPCDNDTAKGINFTNGRLVYTFEKSERMYVDVSNDFESYLATFRKKSLGSLKRKVRKLQNSNKSSQTVRRFTRADEVEEFIALAKPISAVSYQ